VKPHWKCLTPLDPIIDENSPLHKRGICRRVLPLPEVEGATIHNVLYTDRHVAVLTHRGILSFCVDSGGDLAVARFSSNDYCDTDLVNAGLISQEDLIRHRAQASVREVQLAREQKLRLYLSLKDEYDRGELQPPTPPDLPGA
jgi:hypothetical protein